MKISLAWLGDFVEWTETDPLKIADRLTLSTAEIEQTEIQGGLLEHCCVGEILTITKHPKADRLSLVDVKTDKGTLRVVCGGSNLQVSQLVAFAHVGATVKWHGEDMMTLSPVKIRGEESHGMICAASELGIESLFPPKKEDGEAPIVDLSRSSKKLNVGESLREALGLTDVTFHISNTALTQRPDLFSHVGFARECVAIGLGTWKKKPSYPLPEFAKDKLPFGIKNDIEELIPRYCSCLIAVDSIGETPDWMKKRLEATGWRSVSLPVDITNYVTTEVGMPLHCFDADDIKGDISMRLSKKGETIVTLDEVERKLPEGAIVLSDKEGIFDLLGIMGGLRSSTKDESKHLFLHAATVDPISIRKAIIATGHRTDASTVYEKGIPRIVAEQGFARALQLFLELCPGAKVVSKMDSWGDNGKMPAIKISASRVASMLGTSIDAKTITRILEDLECEVKAKGDDLTVTPPLHRSRDLHGPHDLVEEIGRVHGYEHLQPTMPTAEVRVPKRQQDLHLLRESLRGDGFVEILPLSLIGPDLLRMSGMGDLPTVSLENPIGETFSILQPSTLPSLLEHAGRNMLLAGSTLKTFHWGHVFSPKSADEKVEMGLLYAGREKTKLLDEPVLKLKQAVSDAAEMLKRPLTVEAQDSAPAWAHPGRYGHILWNGEAVGEIGEVHPEVATRFGLPARAAAALLDLSVLLKGELPHSVAKPLPHFPSVTYDWTFTRSQKDPIGKLLDTLQAADPLIESVVIHDLFAKGTDYNVTLRCTYRASDRTLTEQEAKAAHEKVMAKAK